MWGRRSIFFFANPRPRYCESKMEHVISSYMYAYDYGLPLFYVNRLKRYPQAFPMVYTIFAIDSLGELVCYWLLVGMHHPPRACLFFRLFAYGIGIHMGGN